MCIRDSYEAFVTAGESELLRDFKEKGGDVLTYSYRIDRGSFLYVQEQIKRVMNKKRSM